MRPEGVTPATAQQQVAKVASHGKRFISKLSPKSVGIIAAAVVLVYLIGVIVFSIWFVPNTKIGIFDASLKTSDEVQKMLDDALETYTFEVTGDGFSFTASAHDAALDIDTKATVDAMHADLSGWRWPLLLIGTHDETERMTTTSGSGDAMQHLTKAVEAFNAKATPPTSANIAYDSNKKSFSVQKESIGTQLDEEAVVKAASNAMAYLQPSLRLDESHLLQPAIKSTDERIKTALEQAETIISSNILLKFASVSVGFINGDTLADMVVLGDDVTATLDQEKLNAWVVDFASKANTAGSTRNYTRDDGKQVTVTGGVYGWEVYPGPTCEAITEAAQQGGYREIAVPCMSEGAVYTGAGERDWGTRYIDVDISEQYVRFYGDDGSIIWESECISGIPGTERETVPGVWYVTDKESPYLLVGYSGNVAQYETPVTYWMPFEGNAIGFHDATWQPDFGGEMFLEGYGSHGCINLPYSKAQSLYGKIQIRDVVVVHD